MCIVLVLTGTDSGDITLQNNDTEKKYSKC